MGPRFAITLLLMMSVDEIRLLLNPSFRFGNSQKSYSAIFGEHGGWGIVDIFLLAENG